MKENIRISVINAREVSSFFNMADESPAVATLLRLLEEKGISAASFPDTEERSDILGYEDKIEAFLKENPSDIVAFSCWTSGYAMAVDMACVARRVCPDALIMAGGPHFSSIEEIETALNAGEFDIIFRGGGSPFVDFCAGLASGDISVERTPSGLFIKGCFCEDGLCCKNGEGAVVIGKRGKLKGAVSPVLEINDAYADIRIIVRDICPNGCDYCVIEPSSQIGDSFGVLLSYCGSFSRFIGSEIKKPVRFALADSAPFADRRKLRPLLDEFLKISPGASFSLFADPQDIDGDMFDIIERYNVTSLFFGRDRVTEDRVLGRRFRGAIRSQAMLDEERHKIEELAVFVSSLKNTSACEIYLGYILSPFETAETSLKMTEELKFFSEYNLIHGGSALQTNLFVLDPYPGTAVAGRMAGKYLPMRFFRHPYPNVWTDENAVHFQMELTRLILSKLLCRREGEELFGPFIDFVHRIQHEGRADVSLASSVADPDLRALAEYIMEKVAAMGFKYLPSEDAYGNNIVNMHLLGCMALVMLNRRDWLKKRLFGRVEEAVKENDGILPLLLKDIKMMKERAGNG